MRTQLYTAAALMALAADGAQGAATPPAAPVSPVAEFEFPTIEGQKFTFDVSEMPPELRMDFLKTGVRTYIANRLNSVRSRHEKDEAVLAWKAFDEATKADPLQTTVAKPEGERPADPDYVDAYNRAVADLKSGNVRKVSDDPKPRKTKDPLVATVTDIVVREVFASGRAKDPKYSFITARKDVGGDGIAYLNNMIEARVAAVAEAERPALRTQLEKLRDEKYINPAKLMLGLTPNKKLNDLPSIL